MNKNNAEQVLATNLNALMASDHSLNTVEKLAKRSGVGTGTIDRLRRAEASARLYTIVAIAVAFKIEPWQLLVPGFDPSNPPILQPVSEAEHAWWAKLRDLAKTAPTQK
jgi:transcriptional regulator with XRE-family HTH domain